jgi:hypothetical protein
LSNVAQAKTLAPRADKVHPKGRNKYARARRQVYNLCDAKNAAPEMPAREAVNSFLQFTEVPSRERPPLIS